jgi:Zn-finger nucleic acid-binding protein
MLCPRDGTALLQRTQQGIEIDHCPTCRGVWLDRGELDKLVAAALSEGEQTERYNREKDPAASFIGELFDF